VNRFRQEESEPFPSFRLDPTLESQQIERLRELRTSRSRASVEKKLGLLEDAARGTENLMPFIVKCSEALVTVGEISDRLRAVFGEYRETLA
jgi:methylmalonyl-CoA mutase N-terminal domain/subunit